MISRKLSKKRPRRVEGRKLLGEVKPRVVYFPTPFLLFDFAEPNVPKIPFYYSDMFFYFDIFHEADRRVDGWEVVNGTGNGER